MPLPPATIREAHNVFAQLAANSPNRELWQAVYARARAENELPQDIDLHLPLHYLSEPERLNRALGSSTAMSFCVDHNIVTLQWSEPAEELISATDGLMVDVRQAIDAMLRRAIDPFEALATWPLDAFFKEEEAKNIRLLARENSGVVPAALEWDAVEGMDYRGYVCAIMKVTRYCNLRCKYCNDWRSGRNHTMQPAVQARLFQRLLGNGDYGTIDVVWHGGEPTTLKQRGFLRILALQRYFLRPGQKLSNRLQTNATQIDHEWVEFLRRYQFSVGVSIDGPPRMHNRLRPDAAGRPTFERVRRGLRLIREAGLLAHVYIVVGESLVDWGAARLLHFLQEEGITWVGLLAMRPDNGLSDTDPTYLDRKRYVQFLLDLHHARKGRPTPWVTVRELDAALRVVQGKPPGHCELMGNCVGAFYSIDPDGSVGHCDKYVGDSSYTLGNVLEHDFNHIRRCAAVRRLIDENERSTKRYSKSCPYFAFCQGWCPHENYIAERHQSAGDRQCCGLDTLFETLLGESNDAQHPRQ